MTPQDAREPILIATSNPHKLREIRAILEPLGLPVVGLDSLEIDVGEPEETGETFEENARLKARHYAHYADRPCLAEDSGLVVDALDGRPGVHSARYAGVGSTRAERDKANNEKLLAEMMEIPPEQRSARFVCAICLAAPDGRILAESRGTFPGMIADQPKGEHGFGYDPLLFIPEMGCTAGELPLEQKNRRSHRAKAVREMALLLQNLPGIGG